MKLSQKYGATALIAGASEGIGAAFATRLASEGFNLVLIARRLQPLQQLAARLEETFQSEVTCIACDLANANASQQIMDTLNGREIDLMVYNAALSYIGPFTKNSVENNLKMAQVNMLSPLNMLHVFGAPMISRGRGAVILMASLAGFQGSGFLSVYAATKAFNRILGESLWYEWKDEGVDVIACCAGATATPGFLNTQPIKTGLINPSIQTPEAVVTECLKKLGKQPSVLTGRGNRMASFIMHKLLPRKLAIKLMGDTTRKMYRI